MEGREVASINQGTARRRDVSLENASAAALAHIAEIDRRVRARIASRVPHGTTESSPAAEEQPLQVPPPAVSDSTAAPSAGPPGPPDSPGDPAPGTPLDLLDLDDEEISFPPRPQIDHLDLEWEIMPAKQPEDRSYRVKPYQARSKCRRFCVDKLRNGEAYAAYLTGTTRPERIGQEFPSFEHASDACAAEGLRRGFI